MSINVELLRYNFGYKSSCLHRASIVLKTLFIIPTDAYYYKIIGMLKTIKIPTIAPTCFGTRRNHHQEAISCLTKTTIMILLCSSLMTWSMLWWHTSLVCKRAIAPYRTRNISFLSTILPFVFKWFYLGNRSE
jgi:hypothetical protein